VEAEALKAGPVLALVSVLGASAFAGELRAQAPPPTIGERETPFVENRGQWADDVSFCAGGGGWRAALDDRGWRLALAGDSDRACVVRMHVQGSASRTPLGVDEGSSLSHFFYGKRQGLGARSFARVRYRELAPGVDVSLRCAAGRLEYDLELEPRADLSALVFEIEGASVGEIADDGTLELNTPLGVLRQSPPHACELDDAQAAHDCASAFVKIDATHFGFELRERHEDMRLVIDPALVWSTYIGGGVSQTVRGIADLAGRGAAITGSTESADFPTTAGVFDPTHNGAVDAFVTKLDMHGRILWSVFLGGLGADDANAIAVDNQGVITIAGTTRSHDLPTTPGAFDRTFGGNSDGFVARISSDGTRLTWCTYLGGSKNDELHALAVNAAGEATVAGWTVSTNFPATFGTFGPQHAPGTTSDGCIARLSANGGGMVWATYLGGSYVDSIEALALLPNGVLVGGSTQSIDFPRTTGGLLGGEDGFVAVLSPNATQLLMSTQVGGSGDDSVRGVALGDSGDLIAAGKTNSPDLPVTPNVFGTLNGGADGFMLRLDPAGAIGACTYLGGTGSDEILALARSKSGDIFATGWTDSADFPTTPGAYDSALNNGSFSNGGDVFVIRTGADLQKLTYATYFGAGDDERAFAIAAVDADTVLLGGETNSYFFPTTPGAHRTSRGVLATSEGFASQLDLLKHPIKFGTGKPTSFGSTPELEWTGFPSASAHDFQFVVNSAMPNQLAVLLVSAHTWNQPFFGGTLYVHPPLMRAGVVPLDFVGYGELPYALSPAAIGTTFFAQAWFADPWDSQGCGLTSGLEVLVYP
jgi:hypothetical protein